MLNLTCFYSTFDIDIDIDIDIHVDTDSARRTVFVKAGMMIPGT